MIEIINEKIQEIKKKQEALIAELRKDFYPILKPLFEKYSDKISSIGWTQYTDHWNDGEECSFNIHTDPLYVNGETEDDLDILNENEYVTVTEENRQACVEYTRTKYSWIKNEIGTKSYIKNKNYDSELASQVNEFRLILDKLSEEFMKDLFGDHVLVTIHATGEIIVEEYEHD